MTGPGILDNRFSDGLIAFTRELIRLQSYSGREEAVARAITSQMEALDYDEVRIDATATCSAASAAAGRNCSSIHTPIPWKCTTPASAGAAFSGEIKDGFLWGRGSADMKSAWRPRLRACSRA